LSGLRMILTASSSRRVAPAGGGARSRERSRRSSPLVCSSRWACPTRSRVLRNPSLAVRVRISLPSARKKVVW